MPERYAWWLAVFVLVAVSVTGLAFSLFNLI